MFLTVHATAGAIIGQSTGNIWLGLIVGFISHYLLDIIPHGDDVFLYDKFNFTQKDVELVIKVGLVDGLIMTILFAFLYWQGTITLTLPILAAVGGSIFPDFLSGLYFLTRHPWLKGYHSWHSDLHGILKLRVSFWPGFFIQLVTLWLLLLLIILF